MPYVNKMKVGTDEIDLTGDSVIAAALLKGYTAHDKSGAPIEGTLEQGGGSLPSGIAAFDAGTITVSADFTTTPQTFNHNLGVVPDMVMVFADGNVAQTYSMLFALRSAKMVYGSTSGYVGYHGTSTTTVTLSNNVPAAYGVVSSTSKLTNTSFQLASSSKNYYWRKGTYKYFAIKWAE